MFNIPPNLRRHPVRRNFNTGLSNIGFWERSAEEGLKRRVTSIAGSFHQPNPKRLTKSQWTARRARGAAWWGRVVAGGGFETIKRVPNSRGGHGHTFEISRLAPRGPRGAVYDEADGIYLQTPRTVHVFTSSPATFGRGLDEISLRIERNEDASHSNKSRSSPGG
ncbi:unnamed protein product, partial [Iphiclides podalirius]